MKFTVVTVFPQMIEGFLGAGLVGTAHERGLLEVRTVNPRQFTSDAHHTVDDRAFGGSDGMVMKYEPLAAAIAQERAQEACRVVLLTPQGRLWQQPLVREYAADARRIVLLCGRYAGIDQRVTTLVDEEVSVGDYILNGGELAACVLIESVARLQPGVLGNALSAERDSFSAGLLECPQFTRPREVAGLKVPAPLLSGHHAEIAAFERAVALVRTQLLRPELSPAGSLRAQVGLLQKLDDAELKALGISRKQLSAME